MSALARLLDVRPGPTDGSWIGPASGPDGKRAFGGQFMAQSLAAATRTVEAGKLPTSMHLQFLRGGEAGAEVDYAVERVYDGRTASARRVEASQDGRLLTTASVSFSVPLAGPEHGVVEVLPQDPDALARTGPVGPAPSMPLDEIDIRVVDDRSAGEFVRRLWWRVEVPLPEDPLLHDVVAAYVCDVYMIDPALRVHGHSMTARTHRSGTTDSSIWFHRRIRADRWNLLETRSPAAARGRAVITGSLFGADGAVAATLVQEGLVAER
ncbi:acyl-CoA thioesterase II [Mycolicibacterium madagascariense]|uniref:Acyl-CoA thioesterase II n=1 Tax=Mycolicibacterium madagascariense TaxID=212765 RepID=A0A7I7XFC6_9MYCO|nr:acyl-CoA thioesterase domain-containing protein [Mycolicibacterium madagascariense]MCV7015549.1 thioesterase family protein [Mycolicibacterium madagascariense]BBZ27885.1 acyl-CoA thioesterase II [Mycolicibacterium madagascariense]